MAAATADRIGLPKVNSVSPVQSAAQTLEPREKNLLASNRQSEYVLFPYSCSTSASRDDLLSARALSGLTWEAALSDEHETHEAAPAAAAPAVNVAELQEQLKSVAAERDRHAFEKSEIVQKANAIARERDEARQLLALATKERDRLAGEASDAARALKEAALRAEDSAKEILGLRQAIETAPSAEPIEVLWALVTKQTQAGLAFLRGKIPQNHPALGWFDKTVDIATQLGCLAVKTSIALAQWARDKGWPLAKQLAAKLASEVEGRLAKK